MVFTSLAAVCVPALCDGCRVGIEEDGAATYRISHPRLDLVGEVARKRILPGLTAP